MISNQKQNCKSNSRFSWILQVVSIWAIIFDSACTLSSSSPTYHVAYRRSYLVLLGDTINLTCPFTSLFYKWTPSTQTSWILSEDQVYSLKTTSLADSGSYICSAVNGFGHKCAEFNIKVIDKSSPTLEQNCVFQSNELLSELGLCFLNNYSETDMTVSLVWGDNVDFDCECVAVKGLAEHIHYSWEFYSYPQTLNPDIISPMMQPGFYSRTGRKNAMLTPPYTGSSTSTDIKIKSSNDFFNKFSGPILGLKNVKLRHAGEYRCIVTIKPNITESSVSDWLNQVKSGQLTRTFRLRVQPRSEGDIIQGPHNVSMAIDLNKDASFPCVINKEEHRSATLRWGKYISLDQLDTTNFNANDVLHWSDGTYVVLPTILPDDLLKFYNQPKQLAVSSPGSGSSLLVVRLTSPQETGLYICSVITESGRDDHKFVRISIKGRDFGLSKQSEKPTLTQRMLTIYIAVPVGIFLLCFCTITSFLIRNHSKRFQEASVHQRNHKFLMNQGNKPSTNAFNSYVDPFSITVSAATAVNPRLYPMSSQIDSLSNQTQVTQFNQNNSNAISHCNAQDMHYILPNLINEYPYYTDGELGVCPMIRGQAMNSDKHLLSTNYPNLQPATLDYQQFVSDPHLSSSHFAIPPHYQMQSYGPNENAINMRQMYPHCSGESSTGTDLGFDQSSKQFNFTNYSLSQHESEGRILCVSPSSGPELSSHLQSVQCTGFESS